MSAAAENVTIGHGRVLLPQAVCARHLAGVEAVALLERDGRALLLPLAGPLAGGLLLKQRNLRGDRVVFAPEFLARCGLDDQAPDRAHPVRWLDAAGALWIEGLQPR